MVIEIKFLKDNNDFIPCAIRAASKNQRTKYPYVNLGSKLKIHTSLAATLWDGVEVIRDLSGAHDL